MVGLMGHGQGLGLCSKCDEKPQMVSTAEWKMGRTE